MKLGAKKLTDLSQLTKAMIKKAEVLPPTPKKEIVKGSPKAQVSTDDSPSARAEAEVLEYFSRTSITEREFAKPTGAAHVTSAARRASDDGGVKGDDCQEQELRARIAALEAERDTLRSELSENRRVQDELRQKNIVAAEELERAKSSIASLKLESAKLRERLSASQNASNNDEAREEGVPAGEKTDSAANDVTAAEKAILKPPRDGAIFEVFPGELREMVIAALADALAAAAQSGRERRAAVLSELLAANRSSGELERRRAALKQALKDAGYFTGGGTLKELEALGFKLISGRNHWKLEYGNVRSPIAKTPSDYRSLRNSASEIANRCF